LGYAAAYRGTSIIRDRAHLGPYSRSIPKSTMLVEDVDVLGEHTNVSTGGASG
jgi:hypothetical protein